MVYGALRHCTAIDQGNKAISYNVFPNWKISAELDLDSNVALVFMFCFSLLRGE